MAMRRLGHVPALDGLRGIAILLVVAHHTSNTVPYLAKRGWFHGGALGVDLFFVLSGFLITSLLLTEWDIRGRISLRAFYERRLRRLLPALLVLVGVAWMLSVAVHPDHAPRSSLFALARITYVGNFLIAFGGGLGAGFTHLWTLAQEEQFYVLWPPLLVFLLRRRVSPGRVLWLLGALIVAVNVDRLLLGLHGASEFRLWYAPDTQSDAILFGCAAGVIWTHRLLRPTRWMAGASLLVAAPILVMFRAEHPLADRGLEYPIALPLFAIACSLLLLSVMEAPEGRLARALSLRQFRRTGEVSYSLYLWHLPLLDFFGLVGLPLAISAALLSYRFVEQPWRRRRVEHRIDRDTYPAPALTR